MEKKELFEHLVKNKDTLIAQKKAELKKADGFSFLGNSTAKKQEVKGDFVVTAIINTTNIMDSHKDVHISGLWKKSLSENKMIMHLQEHQLKFDKIISDGEDLKAYTKEFTWKELGYDFNGTTEALVFESTIKANRNAYMAKEYKNGNVKNHSVGMQYVKLELAINDEDYKEEKAVWDKYIDTIANKEMAEDTGYFWAVKEAKVIEGSAVPIGSNYATPTMNIEPLKGTQYNEPSNDTQFSQLLKDINLF